MPKGSKTMSMPNESSSIVGCSLCDWRCERKGSKQFLKKILLKHLKCKHNVDMTMDKLNEMTYCVNYVYDNWKTTELHKLHKTLKTTMDNVLKKK